MELFALLYAILAGIVPMTIYATLVTWIDRFEKEPWWLMLGTFVWGAVVAAGSAYILNTLFGVTLFSLTGSEALAGIGTAVISAPLVEETVKGAAVLAVFIFFRHEFDSPIDGIIYGSLVGFGFAATENINYIYSAFATGGLEAAVVLTLVRAVGIAFLHAFLTAWIGLGFAAFRLNTGLWRWLALPGGYALAMGFHAVHNLFASLGELLCLLALVIDWLGVLGFAVFIIYLVWRERHLMRTYLQEEVALGLITAEEYHNAHSVRRQLGARLRGFFSGRGFHADVLYDTLGDLAFKKMQLHARGPAKEPEAPTRIDALRAQVARLRTTL